MKKYLVVNMVVWLLSACANQSVYDETRGWSVEKLYDEARSEVDSGNYKRAESLYETISSRFPYGRYAQQSQVELAYSYYKDQEPELAIAAADRFLKLYPTRPQVPYVLYLKGLVYFSENNNNLLARFGGQDMSERDPKSAHEAFLAFSQLVKTFPDSKYTPDATKKMNILLDALGGHVMYIARYYMQREAYIAGINRAQEVVREYANTPYVEEALAMMVEGYHKLGMSDLSTDSRRVLALNFPNSVYLKTPWQAESMPWWKFWR